MSANSLVIVRHGQSTANLAFTYAGWMNSGLTSRGIADANGCGRMLLNLGVDFSFCFCSALTRSSETLSLIKTAMGQPSLATMSSWRLNECHCGQYTGMNAQMIDAQFGLTEFRKWRTSYNIVPPLLDSGDPRSPYSDPLYERVDKSQLPLGESLEMCWTRLEPLWSKEIMPRIERGQNVLVVSHGNIIRAMRKNLESLSEADVMGKKVVANGFPLVYHFSGGRLSRKDTLGNRKERKAMKAVSQVI
jgi:2,3-bisphosphoglycerate-dependent phosphoglycerate mutase